MSIFYDFVYLILIIIYLPVFLFKKKMHPGFAQRLGIFPDEPKFKQPLWVHAVSVGESLAAKQLIKNLRSIYPGQQIIVSTVTATGNKIAGTLGADYVFYLPLDFSFIVRRVTAIIRPRAFICVDTEIWPNLISCLSQKNIPVIVVNGRISDSSFKGYRSIKFLFKSVLGRVSVFCVQTQRDGQRLSCLGVAQGKIRVTGNMKFDIADYADMKADYAGLRLKLGLGSADKLWVCGSTHPQEEEAVLKAYQDLLRGSGNLKLLIAPRHPQRAKEIERIITASGFNPVFISTLGQTPGAGCLKPVFILDSIGELISFYAIADIVFVGGSLIKKGGHNILEPAVLGKPILFGPDMSNFRDIAGLFIDNDAAIRIRGKEGLGGAVKYLLDNPVRATELGQRAKDLIARHRGATANNSECIKSILRTSSNSAG